MRFVLFAGAAALVLTGCDMQPNPDAHENEQTSDIRNRLMSNDSTVCGDKAVQLDALAVAYPNYRKFIDEGGSPIVFEAISATGMNKDIHEVTCGANIKSDNPFLTERNAITTQIEYKLRPSLDDEQGYVIEVRPGTLKSVVSVHMAANTDQEPTAMESASVEEDEAPTQSAEVETAAQDDVENDPGVQLWHELNTKCRGSSDPTITQEACPRRDAQHERLYSAGLCYGKEGEYGAQHRWHRCGPDSIR